MFDDGSIVVVAVDSDDDAVEDERASSIGGKVVLSLALLVEGS